MPVAALHPLPAIVGAGRRRARRHRRFGLCASSLESPSVASTALSGVAAGAPAERKEKVKDDAAALEEEQSNGLDALYDDGFGGVTVKDYFAAARAVSRDDGGPPRWFCPVECGRPAVDAAPLLLFLPGTRSLSWPAARTNQSLPRLPSLLV